MATHRASSSTISNRRLGSTGAGQAVHFRSSESEFSGSARTVNDRRPVARHGVARATHSWFQLILGAIWRRAPAHSGAPDAMASRSRSIRPRPLPGGASERRSWKTTWRPLGLTAELLTP